MKYLTILGGNLQQQNSEMVPKTGKTINNHTPESKIKDVVEEILVRRTELPSPAFNFYVDLPLYVSIISI